MDSTTTEEQQKQSNPRADEHLAAATDGRLIREDGGVERGENDESGRELVTQAAHSEKAAQALDPEQKLDAMAWLLADDEEGEDTRTESWEYNIGTEDNPQWLPWTIRPLDSDAMTGLRQRARISRGNRAARRASGAPDVDMTLFNLFMVAAATVAPDLRKAAEIKQVGSADPLEGPVLLLRQQFRRKPGIVDQIAQRVMLFSGYDEEDARRATPETVMMRAAGNS